jgi:Cu-processing system ATP-binding protein
MVICNEGDIYFDGQNIKGEWKYREKIGYMPQIGRYPENMRIGQVIDMMKDIRGISVKEKMDESLVSDFGLNKMLDKRMGTLSGGTRQKVSAALAFLFNPDALILDEPTAGLDPVSSEILKEKILEEKNKGKLILITSHVLSELDEIISEVIFMKEGKICFHKGLDQLKEDTGEQKLAKAIAHTILETQEV